MSEKKYLELTNEIDSLRYGSGGEKAVAGVKLLGKGLFNTTKFIFTTAVPALTEQMQRDIEKHKSK